MLNRATQDRRGQFNRGDLGWTIPNVRKRIAMNGWPHRAGRRSELCKCVVTKSHETCVDRGVARSQILRGQRMDLVEYSRCGLRLPGPTSPSEPQIGPPTPAIAEQPLSSTAQKTLRRTSILGQLQT